MDFNDIASALSVLLNRFSDPNPRPTAEETPPPSSPGFMIVRNDYGVREIPVALAAPVRRYTFENMMSFVNMLKRTCDPDEAETLGSIGPKGLNICTHSAITHTRDEFRLTIPFNSDLIAWMNATDCWMPVSDFRAHIKSLRESVVNAPVLLADLQEVAVSVSSGATVKIDPKTNLVTYAGQQKNVEVSGRVPDSFTIALPAFDGGSPIRFEVDIKASVDPKAEDPERRLRLSYKIVKYKETVEVAAVERLADLSVLLDADIDGSGQQRWYVGYGTATLREKL